MLSQRRTSLFAVLSTALTGLFAFTLPSTQVTWINTASPLSVPQLQIAALLTFVGTVILFSIEPYIRQEIRLSHAQWLTVAVASTITIISLIGLPQNDQFARLLNPKPFITWSVTQVAVLGFCMIALTGSWLNRPTTPRLRYYAAGLLVILTSTLLTAYTLGVGEYQRLYLPDEPWLVSIATNFAQNGQISASFLGSPYGTPDPSAPRFYVLMGYWLRWAQPENLFIATRWYIFAWGMTSAVLFALVLRFIARLKIEQVLAGTVTFLSFSAFLQTAHYSRMDVGLVLYGVVLLAFMLLHSRQQRRRWLIAAGLLMYPGMECVPTVPIVLNGLFGLMLVVYAFQAEQRRPLLQHVIIYGLACALAGSIYATIHLLPDLSGNLQHYQAYVSDWYGEKRGITPLRLVTYILTFMSQISPLEIPFLVFIGYHALRLPGSPRHIFFFSAAAFVLISVQSISSYGYLAALAAFTGYLAAVTMSNRRQIVIMAFFLLPALAASPIRDTLTARSQQENQQRLAEHALITWQIPEGSRVLANDVFWFVLQDKATVYDVRALEIHASQHQIPREDALRALNIDVFICEAGNDNCALGQVISTTPQPFNITNHEYLIYK